MEAKRKGVVIAFDPGLTGAGSVLGKGFAKVFDLPVFRAHSKGYVDGKTLLDLIRLYAPVLVVVEMAGIRQKQGISSTAQTWLLYGCIVGAVLAAGCTLELVAPAKWKRDLGLIGKSKEASRIKALKHFPRLAADLKRKKDHNRAEALLLAKWARNRTLHG